MYLFNDNSTVKLTVFSLGGCKVVNAPSWMTVIPGTTNNTMEITFKQASSTSTENISATIKMGASSLFFYFILLFFILCI